MNYYALPGLQYQGKTYADIKATTIIGTVAKHYGLTVEEMSSKCREVKLVSARRMAYYFLKNKTNMTLDTMAKLVGCRDHTTVIHSLKTLNDLISVYPHIQNEINEIESKI